VLGLRQGEHRVGAAEAHRRPLDDTPISRPDGHSLPAPVGLIGRGRVEVDLSLVAWHASENLAFLPRDPRARLENGRRIGQGGGLWRRAVRVVVPPGKPLGKRSAAQPPVPRSGCGGWFTAVNSCCPTCTVDPGELMSPTLIKPKLDNGEIWEK